MTALPKIKPVHKKIDLLNQQAWDIRVNDSPKSFKLSQQSLVLARKSKYKKGIAESTRSIGFCYVRLSRNEEAIPLLEESLSLFKELDDLRNQAVVYEYLGVIKRNQGEMGVALELLFKAHHLSTQAGATENDAIHHYQIGVTYKYLGNFDKALEGLFKSISIHKENKNRLYQSYPINVIGLIYFETGDYKRALEYFKEGLKLRQEFKDKLGESGSLDNIGYSLFKLKKYTQALSYCKKALVISKRTGDKRTQASTLQHLAEIYAQTGNRKQAITSSNASRKIRKVTGDKRGEAEILLFLAGVEQVDRQQNLEWIREALRIAEETKSTDIQSRAHHSLYTYYKREGKFREANQQLEKHFKLEKVLQKNSVSQKMANLEIARRAEEAGKEVKAVKEHNEELVRLNHELEIESSLEKVRTVAMGMKAPPDMLLVCRMISQQLLQLGFKEIRNVQTVVIYQEKNEYLNYQYFTPYDTDVIEQIDYRLQPDVLEFTNRMLESPKAYYEKTFSGAELRSWRNYRRKTNQLPDPKLDVTTSAHYYFFSIGSGALGITAYSPLSDTQINLFKRFRNVFALAYQRFKDIEKAEAQAREARIEASLERVRAAAMSMHQSAQLINVAEAMYNELRDLGFENIRNAQISIRDLSDNSYFVSEYSDHVKLAVKETSVDNSPLLKNIYNEMEGSKDAFYQREFAGKEYKEWMKWRLQASSDQDPRIFKSSSMWFHLYSLGTGYIGISTFGPISAEQTQTLKRFRNVFDLAYRRYVDVKKAEIQAREAQIEVAVERVRAKALAMHRSEDLHAVVVTLKTELMGLDIPGVTAATIYLELDDGSIRILDLTTAREETDDKVELKLDRTFRFEDTDPKLWVRRMWERKESYFVEYADKSDFKRVVNWLYTADPEGAKLAEKIIREKNITQAWLPTVKLEKGVLNIDLLDPPGHEIEPILVKMGAGFDLAYKRFLDLQKAEAQAREAMIETALERVRSRTMAMHRSDELLDTADVVQKELSALGINSMNVSYAFVDADEKYGSYYSVNPVDGRILPIPFVFPHTETAVMRSILASWKKQEAFHVIRLNENKTLQHQTYIGEHIQEQLAKNNIPFSIQQFLDISPKQAVLSTFNFSKGYLFNIGEEPLSKSQEELMIRFTRVFEQTYTRFLDLQQAEAQAREARVEAALEKVRSRSLAMHTSTELGEVATVVLNNLQDLGYVIDTGAAAHLAIFSEDTKDFVQWSADPVLSSPVRSIIPYTDHPILSDFFEAKEKGLDFFAGIYTYEQKNTWFKYAFEHSDLKYIPEELKQMLLGSESYAHSIAIEKNSAIIINSITGNQLSENQIDILKRFARVFEQAYIRFLDLQKAEAQAREAQIETALERVRSRTMGMQKSEELKEVIQVVFEQFVHLNMNVGHTGFVMDYKTRDDYHIWVADPHGAPSQVTIPYFDSLYYNRFNEAKEKGIDFFPTNLSFEEKNKFYKTLFKHVPGLPEEAKEFYFNCPGLAASTVLLENIGLYIENFSGIPYTDEENSILMRFGRVFQQTYTRFLDLQKAEEQARESNIQLALERVRARTMAMQKSDELPACANLLFHQIQNLGMPTWAAGYCTWEENKEAITLWMSSEGVLQPPFKAPTTEDELFIQMRKGNEDGKSLHIVEMGGEELAAHYRYMRTLPVVGEIFDSVLEAGHLLPTFQVMHYAYFSKGFLLIITYEPIAEAQDIFTRFAGVFDQTYTRFLDLQKAEAQARESQIELGLERVRARAMAMQNSEELNGLIGTVFTELTKLDLILTRAVIMIFNADTNSTNWWMANAEEPDHPKGFFVRSHDHPPIKAYFEAWRSRQLKWTYELHGRIKKEWDAYLFSETELSNLPPYVIEGMKAPDKVYLNASFNNFGNLTLASLDPLSEQQFDILLRFAKVFDLTYTRFNDLQKAEAQAKEAKIEASLERVRAKAMSMRHSDELDEVLTVLFDQFDHLGIESVSTHVTLIDIDNNTFTFRETGKGGHKSFGEQTVPIDSMDIWKEAAEKWRTSKPLSINYLHFPKESLPTLWQVFQQTFDSMPEGAKIYPEDYPDGIHHTAGNCQFGYIGMNQVRKATEEEEQIVLKFATEFGRVYQRFLDLQKAEEQTREAKIETSLERVRSKAMAMHSSEDLAATIGVFYREMESLTFTPRRCGVGLINKETRIAELSTMNTTADGESIEIIGKLKMAGHPVLEGVYDNWLLQKEYHPVLRGKEINEYYALIRPQITFPDYSADTAQYGYFFFFPEGGVYAWTDKELSEDELSIYRRFTSVLSLTYKRYKDLQKAEEQAREAQIEAALERVRSKAMAMHKTEDLHSAVAVVFEELDKLNLGVLRVGLSVLNKEKRTGDVWVTSIDHDKSVQVSGDESFDIHPLLHGAFEAWLRQEDFYYVLEGADLTEYYKAVSAAHFQLPESQMLLSGNEAKQYCFAAVYNSGGLFAFRDTEFPEEAKKVMRRFAGVFDLTYKRFLDLQKAETQAREAQIEASLERVRGKAMSMHSSKDLSDTVDIFFKELKVLGIIPLRCGVGELDEATRTSTLSATTAQRQGDSYEMIGKLKLTGHPVLDNIFEHWKKQEEYFPVLTGHDLTTYYQVMRPQVNFPEYPDNIVHYGYYFFFQEGLVFAWTDKELSEEELHIFRKFTSVISLTYRRYIELQKSEANAHEAIKQASLDRIRADIASMRTTDDLQRITPLIWNELSILGIPFIRCGVFIMDEGEQLIHTFLSTPDGKAIGSFHLPFTTPGNMQQVLSHWRKGSKYIDHWEADEFTGFANILKEQGTITSTDQYMKGIPTGGFHLHFLPFLQGMLYVGNTVKLQEEDIDLIQSVADAFSTAYARYEDFNKLEIAKAQVDNTLSHLKQAQAQLVQSEKMASLGELTAGIAHEIQNPLNFVNNFSEVSNELIDEMVEEVAKGNYAEAKAIAEDVKQNLEKINHHGKRADGIVKGMLQHSRSSSGQKELTDINVLADEYLRLAYHGLRAKDKTFNAKFEAQLDPSMEKINVMPQDMGRVILNLINNAFYAVSEKKKTVLTNYEPTVTVTTKKENGHVEICVKDNGGGIPQKVMEKIFQPFFTTKPTGQGTGLGLSLSYDIVKAHGGELKVETREGAGSEFIINLPVDH